MTTQDPAPDAARADVRELIAAKGHSVDNARAAMARLDEAFAQATLSDRGDGPVPRRPDAGARAGRRRKLGGRARAARFILRAVDRELDNA